MKPSYYDEDTKERLPLKEARAVTFEVMGDHVFWLHESVNGEGWTVTESETGLYVTSSRNTQREARTIAEAYLNKSGRAGTLGAIELTLKRRENRSSARRNK